MPQDARLGGPHGFDFGEGRRGVVAGAGELVQEDLVGGLELVHALFGRFEELQLGAELDGAERRPGNEVVLLGERGVG